VGKLDSEAWKLDSGAGELEKKVEFALGRWRSREGRRARLLLVLRRVLMLAGRGRVKAILLVKADVLAWRRVRSVVRRHRWVPSQAWLTGNDPQLVSSKPASSPLFGFRSLA
jgi:hypothetical protein